jgi:hypothetical protein
MRTLKFDILEEVHITPLPEQLGTIINILIDNNDIRYTVRYFVCGELKETLFYERELSSDTKHVSKQIGFKSC